MKEAAAMGVMVSLKELKKMFAFDDFPKLKNRVKKLLGSFRKSLTSVISKGVEAEMTLAAEKGSDIVQAVVGKIPATAVLPKEIQVAEEVMVRKEVVDAFLQRRVNGLSLSDRVWKLTDQMKEEIEMILDLGIRESKSADELSRDLRKYLQHPDELYRRVRDEHGNLIPSKKAQTFHPGRGVYRSSYMNARRLAATETNIAYRKADYDRYQQLDFVVGIEIHLSNNHNCKGVPEGMFHDICDELAGKYPKDFLFVGWHPHCRCYVTTILKTDEELAADRKRMLNGEPLNGDSVNRVDDVPDNFKKWLKDNEERIERAKNLPYFLRDNGSLDDEGEYRLKEFGDAKEEDEISLARKKYQSYDENWERVYFNDTNGGYNVYHRLHQFSGTKAKGAKMSGGEAEKLVGRILARVNAKRVEFLLENKGAKGNPDLGFDELTWDVKYISKANVGTIRKYIEDSRKADCAIFYWDDENKIEDLKEAINRSIGKYRKKGELSSLPSMYYINSEEELVCLFFNS